MENTAYVAMSRQAALKTQMDLIANNIANMSTPGYRAQNVVFQEYVSKPLGSDLPLSMVLNYGQYQDTKTGPMTHTGNVLDMAIQGPGYFQIQTEDGIRYTRAGSFRLNNLGEIVDGEGRTLVNEEGASIIVPAGSTEIKISKEGLISNQDGDITRIKLSEFEDPQSLEALGNGLYKTDDKPQEAELTTLVQGSLEGSNVNSVLEMTRMVDVLHAYQSTQRMLQTEHDRQRTMIRQLTQATG